MAYKKTAQIAHSLSFASNSAFGLKFDTFNELQQYVETVSTAVMNDTTIQGLIGDDWDTVWGPVVYSSNPTPNVPQSLGPYVLADNTMGVYYSKAKNLFVVAIAGTNSISGFGWMAEDFNVGKVVAWSSITGAGKGHISQGTATGLDVLVSMMKSGGDDLLTGLSKYITNNKVSGAELAVSGHSLGGALSPALALYLLNKQSVWDPSNSVMISAYPTAGATIGTNGVNGYDSFVKYYENHISSTPTFGKVNYHSYCNALDIVPHAWQGSDLEQIPDLYQKEMKANHPVAESTPAELVMGLPATAAALNRIGKKTVLGKTIPVLRTYKQVGQDNPDNWTWMKGTFDNDVDTKAFNTLKHAGLLTPQLLKVYIPYISSMARFLFQAAYQHTKAYNYLLNIEDFMTEYENILKQHKPTKAAQFDAALEHIQQTTGMNIHLPLDKQEAELAE